MFFCLEIVMGKTFRHAEKPSVKHDKKLSKNANCLLFQHETVYYVMEAKIMNFANADVERTITPLIYEEKREKDSGVSL